MVSPLLSFSLPQGAPDFTLNGGDFSAAEVELVAVSDRGRARMAQAMGGPAVSCRLPKSAAIDAAGQLAGEGYVVAGS